MYMKNKNVSLIYLSEFTARLCTWSILSGLLIHITDSKWVNSSTGLNIMGSSLSLLYLCSMFGGYIKDRFFNEEQTIVIGMFIIGIGSLALINFNTLYIGLGLLFIGAGMVTPMGPLLLSKLDNQENNTAFTTFYGITNSGIILGPIIGGFIEKIFSWQGVIVLNEVMIVIWVFYLQQTNWLSYLKDIKVRNFINFVFLLLIGTTLTYLCLTYQNISKYLLFLAIAGYIVFLTSTVRIFKQAQKKLIFAMVLILFAIVFFCGEFQVTSSLIVYADNFVRLKEFNFNLPVSSLVSLESIFVVIGSFIITKMALFNKIKFSQTRVLIGLCCCAAAFLILYCSTFSASAGKISLSWIVLPFLLLGLGEVTLMPPIMSYIAKEAPAECKGRLMSGMYFALSISGYISGFIGEAIMQQYNLSNHDLSFYSAIFLTILGITVVCSILLVILRFNSMRFLGVLQ